MPNPWEALALKGSARPCSVCRGPTRWETPRGRAVHPMCDPVRSVLSESAEWAVIRLVCSILPVRAIERT